MPKIKREYAIALMMIGALVLLYFGMNYLKGLNVFGGRNVYYAVYRDVSGINDASPVLFHGMKVGQVVGTELMADGSGNVAVAYQISDERLKLTKDSQAEIYSSDLFTRAIQIVLGDSIPAQPGDTLSGGAQASLTESVNQQLDPIKRKAEGMLSNIDSVLTAVQGILNVEARNDIDASFTSLRGTMQSVEATTKRLDGILVSEAESIKATFRNLEKVSATLAVNSDELNRIFSNVDTLTASLAHGQFQKVMNDLSATSGELKATIAKLNEGQGTLGKLIKDDSLYTNLNRSSHQLDLLLEDLRMNPNRYFSVFGKKDKLPKLSDGDIERIRQSYEKQQGTKP